MKRLLSLTLALALCFALAGCWETDAGEPQDFWEMEPETTAPTAERSAKADVLTLPYLNSQTLDPVACSDGVQQVVGSLLYESLFTLDEHFEPQPLLCASHSVNGSTYTFTLRDDVAFSDGAALTANDVLTTYRRAQVSERYAARFENIASMRVNRGALVITLKRADSALPALLDIPIVKGGTEKDPVPLGTGPYLFLTDTDGPCLVRNENWWRGDPVSPERIALAPAKDTDTAVYLFSAENAHLLTADLLGETPAASLGGVDMADAPTTTMLFLGFHTKRLILANASFRAALGTAFDRDAMVTTLLAGHASAAQFPISPASPLYPATLETPYAVGAYAEALDPPAAEGAEPAEHAPVELTLLVNAENSFKVAIAEYLARQLTEAYVTVEPVVLPWTDYLAALENGDFDLWLGEVRLTADWDITSLVGTNGALNYGGYADAATDAALQTFLASESMATAAALCARLAAEAPILPLVFKTVTVLTPEGLIDGVSPTMTQPLRELPQWTIRLPQ